MGSHEDSKRRHGASTARANRQDADLVPKTARREPTRRRRLEGESCWARMVCVPQRHIAVARNAYEGPSVHRAVPFFVREPAGLETSARRAVARMSGHGWPRKRARRPGGSRQDAGDCRASPVRRERSTSRGGISPLQGTRRRRRPQARLRLKAPSNDRTKNY